MRKATLKVSGTDALKIEDPRRSLMEILLLPKHVFVYSVYRILLGRNPDGDGLVHYQKILNKSGKILVLLQMRTSSEGRQKLDLFVSPPLDKLARYYMILRSMPLGKMRWVLLDYVVKLILPDVEDYSVNDSDYYSANRLAVTEPQAEMIESLDAERERYWIYRICGTRISARDLDKMFGSSSTESPITAEALIEHIYLK